MRRAFLALLSFSLAACGREATTAPSSTAYSDILAQYAGW